MTRDVFNKLIDELYVSAKNVLKNKNALYGKKMILCIILKREQVSQTVRRLSAVGDI